MKLIDSGQASYCIHIENPLTTFRYSHLSSEKNGNITIDEKNINNKIDISTFIIAKEDIHNYTNKNSNKDYDGITFDIKKGSILAISDYVSITVDKDNNDIGAKDSIFSFIKLQKDGPMQYEIGDDRIVIKLGKTDFEKLQLLQEGSNNKNIIYSIFIFPALIFVFESIKGEDIGIYSDNLWFRSLEKILNSNGLSLDSQTIKTKTSFYLAQKLLDEPISHALDEILEGGGESELSGAY